MPIEQGLRGKRFFITGATGFLGTALVERILRCVPDAEITVLIRPGRRADASARLAREVIKNDCFDRVRSELGDGLADEVARRVRAVAGDVGRDCSASTTTAARRCGWPTSSSTRPPPCPSTPPSLRPSRSTSSAPPAWRVPWPRSGSAGHLISVSTAYVASTHQGEAKEELLSENRFTLDVPWRDEVASARRLRDDLQAESRRPEKLEEFTKKARSEVGAAGDHLIASRAEKVREEWVSDELVKAGTARALSLGWPDAYPFTKALGERALVEQWEGTVPITFVRPSIIESAVAEPRPGWIRGFRMAEPIIISYARGLLREFPGVPEGIVDVIPVDLVVAAILAVAAHGPEPGRPKVYQVASGVRNPLRYGRLVELSNGFFQRNPLYDERGQPINVPEWSFPGRGRVQRQLRRADRRHDVRREAAHCLADPGQAGASWPPGSRTDTPWPSAPSATSSSTAPTPRPTRATGSTTCIELWDAVDAEDHEQFGFDPAAIDWDRYVHEIHLPSVLEHTRVRTKPGKSVVDKRPERARRAILSAGPAVRRVRPRAHAHVVQRRRHLRLAGQPPPVADAAGPLRGRPACARSRRCWPSTGATAATSSSPSTAASRTPRWRSCRRTRGSSSTASS